MKKIASIVMSLSLLMVAAFSLAGCTMMAPPVNAPGASQSSPRQESSSKESSRAELSKPESSEEESSREESSKEESSSSVKVPTGKYASISEFLDSALFKSQIASVKKAMEDQGMKVELIGEGNKLVYEFTLSEEYSSIDGLAEGLEAGLTQQAATFENVASSLSAAVDVEDPIVEVRYLANDGSLIYSKEFRAK